MALEAVFVEFSPQEDRIVLKVHYDDTSEMLFFFTRRLVRMLWPVLMQLTEGAPEIQRQPLPEARKALVEMKREEALQQVTFTAPPPQPKPRVRATGDHPLLVTTIQASRNPQGLIVLSLRPDNTAAWDLTLTDRLLHALIKLFQDAVARAEWALELQVPKTLAAPPSAGSPGTMN